MWNINRENNPEWKWEQKLMLKYQYQKGQLEEKERHVNNEEEALNSYGIHLVNKEAGMAW